MSRSLPGLFSVLLLAAALRAGEPGVPGGRAPADALFDAARLESFAPGRKDYILALEGGRYTVVDGRLVDGKTPHPLTNAEVLALLAAAPGGTSDARDAAILNGDAGRPDGAAAGDRGRAVLGQTNFDGSTARAGGPGDPAVPSGSAALPPARLQALFLNQLVFTGTPKEKAAMSEAVENILKTKTGRELVAQYVDEKGSAEIAMGSIAGSTIVIREGRKVPSGSGGNTSVDRDPPLITLNRDYMSADADYRRVAMAATLAHELLGHAFATQRARRAGLKPSVNYYYRGDEIGAELIGWLVQTELSGKTVGDADGFLSDPEAYYRGLWTNQPYYVNILSPQEMKNPLPALRARRAVVARGRTTAAEGKTAMLGWRPVIEHFVNVHAILRERFKPCADAIDLYVNWADDQTRQLDEISRNLENRIAFWSSPAGKTELAELKAGGDSDFLKRADRLLADRRAELIRLRDEAAAGNAPPPAIPLPSLIVKIPGDPNAPIEMSDLVEMQNNDTQAYPANSPHWKK